MTVSEARTLAQQHIDASGITEQGQRLVIYPEDEAADDLGWCYVFYYNTERYIQTNNLDDAMGPGRGPIAVVKKDSTIHEMGGAPGYEERLVEWGRTHGYL